jgi:hypothetical protein
VLVAIAASTVTPIVSGSAPFISRMISVVISATIGATRSCGMEIVPE